MLPRAALVLLPLALVLLACSSLHDGRVDCDGSARLGCSGTQVNVCANDCTPDYDGHCYSHVLQTSCENGGVCLQSDTDSASRTLCIPSETKRDCNESAPLATGSPGGAPYAEASNAVIADLDGDGRSDLVLLWASVVQVHLNKAGGLHALSRQVTDVDPYLFPDRLTVADVNGDGHRDLVVEAKGWSFRVALGRGDGTFEVGRTYSTQHDDGGTIVGASDVNGDGFDDLVLLRRARASVDAGTAVVGQINLWLGSAKGGMTRGPTTPIDATLDDLRPVSAYQDFDGDGVRELIVVTSGGQLASIVIGKEGAASLTVLGVTGASQAPLALAGGDVDGDGRIDLVVATSTELLVVRNLGGALSTAVTQIDARTQSPPQSVYVGDLNGDRRGDLVTSGYDDNDDHGAGLVWDLWNGTPDGSLAHAGAGDAVQARGAHSRGGRRRRRRQGGRRAQRRRDADDGGGV